MTPEQMADRLGGRFALLSSGSRTAMPPHQTLRAVVDWRWYLLHEAGQAAWRRNRGGWGDSSYEHDWELQPAVDSAAHF